MYGDYVERIGILKIFKIAFVGVSVAIAFALLQVGQPWEIRWWAFALPVLAWMIGPGAAAYYVAAKRPSALRLVAMGLYFTAFALTAAVGYYEGLIRSQSSTASLVVFFVPLYQWAAFFAMIPILALFEWMVDGRRSRS